MRKGRCDCRLIFFQARGPSCFRGCARMAALLRWLACVCTFGRREAAGHRSWAGAGGALPARGVCGFVQWAPGARGGRAKHTRAWPSAESSAEKTGPGGGGRSTAAVHLHRASCVRAAAAYQAAAGGARRHPAAHAEPGARRRPKGPARMVPPCSRGAPRQPLIGGGGRVGAGHVSGRSRRCRRSRSRGCSRPTGGTCASCVEWQLWNGGRGQDEGLGPGGRSPPRSGYRRQATPRSAQGAPAAGHPSGRAVGETPPRSATRLAAGRLLFSPGAAAAERDKVWKEVQADQVLYAARLRRGAGAGAWATRACRGRRGRSGWVARWEGGPGPPAGGAAPRGGGRGVLDGRAPGRGRRPRAWFGTLMVQPPPGLRARRRSGCGRNQLWAAGLVVAQPGPAARCLGAAPAPARVTRAPPPRLFAPAPRPPRASIW
jgi:hypothetical protein